MATATVVRVQPKPVPQVIKTVTLELSQEEAGFLATVCERVGGDPMLSRRRHADSIRIALRAAAPEFRTPNLGDISGNGHVGSNYGALYFKNEKE